MISPRGGLLIASSKLPKRDAPDLVLASASPRRRELLQQLGLTPARVRAPDLDEAACAGELPRALALRLAQEKVAAIAALEPGAVVLAADTVVACGRRALPKTETAQEAEACLEALSGRAHVVHTGLAVQHGATLRSRLVSTRVAFKRLDRQEIAAYLACGEWRGKAGGYAIQGKAAAFVRGLNGSYSGVVGLPLHETAMLLRSFGIAI